MFAASVASLDSLGKYVCNGEGYDVDEDDGYYCVKGCIPEGMEEGRILENADVVLDSYEFHFCGNPEFTE